MKSKNTLTLLSRQILCLGLAGCLILQTTPTQPLKAEEHHLNTFSIHTEALTEALTAMRMSLDVSSKINFIHLIAPKKKSMRPILLSASLLFFFAISQIVPSGIAQSTKRDTPLITTQHIVTISEQEKTALEQLSLYDFLGSFEFQPSSFANLTDQQQEAVRNTLEEVLSILTVEEKNLFTKTILKPNRKIFISWTSVEPNQAIQLPKVTRQKDPLTGVQFQIEFPIYSEMSTNEIEGYFLKGLILLKSELMKQWSGSKHATTANASIELEDAQKRLEHFHQIKRSHTFIMQKWEMLSRWIYVSLFLTLATWLFKRLTPEEELLKHVAVYFHRVFSSAFVVISTWMIFQTLYYLGLLELAFKAFLNPAQYPREALITFIFASPIFYIFRSIYQDLKERHYHSIEMKFGYRFTTQYPQMLVGDLIRTESYRLRKTIRSLKERGQLEDWITHFRTTKNNRIKKQKLFSFPIGSTWIQTSDGPDWLLTLSSPQRHFNAQTINRFTFEKQMPTSETERTGFHVFARVQGYTLIIEHIEFLNVRSEKELPIYQLYNVLDQNYEAMNRMLTEGHPIVIQSILIPSAGHMIRQTQWHENPETLLAFYFDGPMNQGYLAEKNETRLHDAYFVWRKSLSNNQMNGRQYFRWRDGAYEHYRQMLEAA